MKIIAFDLDKTLLRDDKTVGEYTVNILNRLRELGSTLVVNTARSELFTAELEFIPECDYYVYNGGALIKDAQGNTVFREEIPAATVAKMISDISRLTEDFSVQTDNALYTSSARIARPEVQVFDFSSRPFDHSALKVLAKLESDDDMRAIAERYGVEAITYVGGAWRRFNTLGTCKLSAMKVLCERLNVPLSDCIFFGDDYGDLDAIDGVGVGVLMKNADDAHKTENRIVSDYTNDEEGVAKFLSTYFGL